MKNHKTRNVPVKSKTTNSETLNVFSVNANGMKKKVDSLKYLLEHLSISLFTLQETKLSKRGKLKIEEFEIFEAFRKKEGGGTLIGAHLSLHPILIQEYSDIFELLVIEIKIEGREIRVISGYGPQET